MVIKLAHPPHCDAISQLSSVLRPPSRPPDLNSQIRLRVLVSPLVDTCGSYARLQWHPYVAEIDRAKNNLVLTSALINVIISAQASSSFNDVSRRYCIRLSFVPLSVRILAPCGQAPRFIVIVTNLC